MKFDTVNFDAWNKSRKPVINMSNEYKRKNEIANLLLTVILSMSKILLSKYKLNKKAFCRFEIKSYYE